MITFDVYTLFPDMFSILNYSVVGKSKDKIWSLNIIKLPFKSDDTVYGGGPGMIIRPDAFDNYNIRGRVLCMSPRGRTIDKDFISEIQDEDIVSIICPRYEGIDKRVIDEFKAEEISIGDFILSGGDIPAILCIDAIVRKIEGVLGNKESLLNESFENNLLECDQYTKPSVWRDRSVPKVLLNGNHKLINKWRKENSIENTKIKRPDLWQKYLLNDKMKKNTPIDVL